MKNLDPVTSDPLDLDRQNPTQNQPVTFDSGGSHLLGLLHITQGAGPHPTVILLHGIPGYERQFDLAQALRRAGWNVLVFHYRGCWGSPGTYSLTHVLEDVRAALAFLRSEGSRRGYRVDPHKIVLIGHSLGAFAALTMAAEDHEIQAAGALALFDLGAVADIIRRDAAGAESMRTFFEWTLPPLLGTSADALMQEVLANRDRWALVDKAARLVERSLLLVDASRDTTAPPALHSQPFLAALQANNARACMHIEMDSDHAFTDKRIALARAVVGWAEKLR